MEGERLSDLIALIDAAASDFRGDRFAAERDVGESAGRRLDDRMIVMQNEPFEYTGVLLPVASTPAAWGSAHRSSNSLK
jgi:hypothetical protein